MRSNHLLSIFLFVTLLAACESSNATELPVTPDLTEPSVTITDAPVVLPADWLWEHLPGGTPTAWSSMAAVFDEGRGVIVLFGGRTSDNVLLSETWEFNGISWNQVTTSHAPPARIWHAMSYDSARKVVVLFGGNASTSIPVYLDDTWEYDGRDWTQVEPTASPAPRSNGALVYDSCRQVTVLFGGENAEGYKPSTWEYDGQTWTEKKVAVSPPGRGLPAMVFDPARCRTVLFGGGSGGYGLNDTWEYDGVVWSQVRTSHTPDGRWAHAMAYSPSDEGVVLFGGYLPGRSTTVNDTWLYDGDDWLQLHLEESPAAQEQHVLSNGFRGGNLLLFGNGEMWVFLNKDAVADLTITPELNPLPIFTYPQEGEELFSTQGYAFKIEPIPDSEGYLWGFFQDGVMVWENLRDAGTLDGNEYTITESHPAFPLIQSGELEVMVRGWVAGNWTEAASIKVVINMAPSICSVGWSRLIWGGYAIVTPGDLPNRVRSAPNTDQDNVISTLYPGDIVQVVEGPWCNDGLVFWKVENDSIPGGSGWTAEGDGTEYWLEPYNP